MTEPPAGPDANSADSKPTPGESGPAKVGRLLMMYPDRLSTAQVIQLLGISRRGFRVYHEHRIPYLQIEGIKLFDGAVARAYAKARVRKSKSSITIKGIEVERLQRICEQYYRQNLDFGPPELLAIAKRIARL